MQVTPPNKKKSSDLAELQGTPVLGWGCLSTLQPPLVAPLKTETEIRTRKQVPLSRAKLILKTIGLTALKCNVDCRKLFSVLESHVRQTRLVTGAIQIKSAIIAGLSFSFWARWRSCHFWKVVEVLRLRLRLWVFQ